MKRSLFDLLCDRCLVGWAVTWMGNEWVEQQTDMHEKMNGHGNDQRSYEVAIMVIYWRK